ncbi:hypothetical protein, partial [Escherichia coli]|uniref:hypothetical protein n=1 Tax=Escherichia coli TaxID=562 RepID=UPI00197AB94E
VDKSVDGPSITHPVPSITHRDPSFTHLIPSITHSSTGLSPCPVREKRRFPDPKTSFKTLNLKKNALSSGKALSN